jgi:GNAT superfamily N-acetyltransferase
MTRLQTQSAPSNSTALAAAEGLQVLIAQSPSDISLCYEAMKVLRPHLEHNTFVQRVQLQQAEGYVLAYIAQNGMATSATGFRIANFLAWGKVLYIDDLITTENARGKGFGGRLLKWVIERAKENQCDAVHLDTGHHRHDAHRLYLNHGFRIGSHHMGLDL